MARGAIIGDINPKLIDLLLNIAGQGTWKATGNREARTVVQSQHGPS